jgi:DNA-binding response OmpR family regulator
MSPSPNFARKSTNVLVVEDEVDVRNLMMLHLEREGYNATGVEDSEKALQLIQQSESHFDLLVLDWMLPGLSGLELCKRLSGRVPILMVTARADSSDIVLGLEMGADDYLTKPFQISVFNARVRAILRRVKHSKSGILTKKFELDNLTVDVEHYKTTCSGVEVNLTPSEFKALVALLRNRGVILSRSRLIEMIQGEGITVTERAIDTMIFGLRKNLGLCGTVIETVRGIGYRIRGEDEK